MSDLDYKIHVDRSNLARDIAERLEGILPGVSLEDRFRIADNSIEAMSGQGNWAIYRGLVEYCLKEISSSLAQTLGKPSVFSPRA